MAAWPEWSGKFDKFVFPGHTAERGVETRRVASAQWKDWLSDWLMDPVLSVRHDLPDEP